MGDRWDGEMVRVVWVGMDMQVREGVGERPGGQRAYGVHVDWRGRGGRGVHCGRNRGDGGSRQGQLDSGSSGRHVHRTGHPKALLLVGLEHVGEAEPLATHVARIRLLARVGSAVPLHVGAAGEALATDFTDEGFLSSMCFHVLVEVLLHVEIFAAPLAHELFVSNVNAHMGA